MTVPNETTATETPIEETPEVVANDIFDDEDGESGSLEEQGTGQGDKPETDAKPKDGTEKPATEGETQGETPPATEAGNIKPFEVSVDLGKYGKYLEARKYVDENGFDVNRLLNDVHEKEAYVTKTQMALSEAQSQIQALKVKAVGAVSKEITEEEVEVKYEETISGLQGTKAMLDSLVNALPQDKLTENLRAQLTDSYKALEDEAKNAKKEYRKNLSQIQKRNFAKEFGLNVPSEDIAEARVSCDNNFKECLGDKFSDENYKKSIIDSSLPFLRQVAAHLFPDLYDSTNPASQQSNEAIIRTMANKEVAKFVLDSSKNAETVKNIEKVKVSEYQRGLKDGQGQKNSFGVKPQPGPVKKMVIDKDAEDACSFIQEALDNADL